MTAVLISVLAALATLAVVLLALRLPRVTGAPTEERIAAVTMDMTARMEAMRRDLMQALEQAEQEAGRQRLLGELAGTGDLEAVLRRTLEAAASLANADAALLQLSSAEAPAEIDEPRAGSGRIIANLGLAPDEARRLTISGPPDAPELRSIFLSYRYAGAELLADRDPIQSGVAVVIPGESQPLGYLAVFARSASRRFGADDARRLEELVARAGPVIENTRLIHEARGLVGVDPVTGLANRRRFAATLTREVGEARRWNRPLALALLDLDDFGAINRRLGWQAGDEALGEAAERARAALGRDAMLARVGADEFAILLPGGRLADAQHVCRRLRGALASPPAGRAGALSFSAGIAELARGEEPDAFSRRAEAALHRARAGVGEIVASEID